MKFDKKKDKLIEKAERLLANGKPIADKYVKYTQPNGQTRYILLLQNNGLYYIVSQKYDTDVTSDMTYSVWKFEDESDAIECYQNFFAQPFNPALN